MNTRFPIVTATLLVFACGGKSSQDGPGGSGGTGTGGGAGAAVGGSSGTAGTGSGSGASASGGGTSGAGAIGGTGGTAGMPAGGAPGGGGAPCDSLQAAYIEQVKKAKACDLNPQSCAKKVPAELECPCGDTYVEPSNEAMKNLKDLAYFWNQQKCGVGIACPDIACVEPSIGSCQADGNLLTGTCQDGF